MAVGMNIERVTDWMAAWMFTDAFKESRPWIPEVYNTTTHSLTQDTTHIFSLNLDAHGWPLQLGQTINAQGQRLTQLLETEMFDGLGGHYAPGTYTAQWDGTGTVEWSGDVRLLQQGVNAAGHHYALLSDTPANLGIHMRIDAMSAADPIHDVHVWMPDYNGQSFVGQVWQPGAGFSPFHPLFLQRLQPFSTLRFMQADEIITSQVHHWSDRRPFDYATQQSGNASQGYVVNGMAPEYAIELCNELNANLWVNIPHMADDNYAQNLAVLVHNTLKPTLHADLEWSNEVWNRAPGFMPYQWITQQLQLPQNAGVTFTQFVANQERRVFGIWSQVFADRPGELVRVAAGFEQNPAYTASLLQALNGQFDAVSCAAYFGQSSATLASYTANTSVDQVLSDMQASIPQTITWLTAHEQMAAQYSTALGRHISLLAYEGGPSLEGHYQPYQAVLNAASVDPRMYGIYSSFLRSASQAGLEELTNYEYTDRNINTPYGIYGALNYQDQPIADAPKYRALVDYITANAAPTLAPLSSQVGNLSPAQAGVASLLPRLAEQPSSAAVDTVLTLQQESARRRNDADRDWLTGQEDTL
jgi:hypothetical protein